MKKISLIIIFLILTIPTFHVNSFNDDIQNEMFTHAGVAADKSFDVSKNVGDIMGLIISAFLSLLALIFIILFIIAGFQYFTAQGNETKTKEAANSIKTAVIGLILILTAYAITKLVFTLLGKIE